MIAVKDTFDFVKQLKADLFAKINEQVEEYK
jgi:hypothetical protein